MAFIIKFAKGVRNHWKKSTFAACLLSYGANWAKEKYEAEDLMRLYCEEAMKYGKESIDGNVNPRTITVILNPAANKRKSVEEFEKYCAPILNLAGILVEVVQTDSEGHAKELVQELTGTDAVVVGGGDGTLSEVITGLLRRTSENYSNSLVPIGVLPLGKHNTVSSALFPGGNQLAKIKSMADASLAIVEEVTKPMDVMKIEIIETDMPDINEAEVEMNNDEKKIKDTIKPIYALSVFEWGAYRDASSRKDKYWYYGPLKKYATYIFNGYKDNLNWKCDAIINYSLPCNGCSNCSKPRDLETTTKWYHRFLSSPKHQAKDFSKVINEDCKTLREKKVSTSDLALLTSNVVPNTVVSNNELGPPKLHLNLGPESVSYVEFVKEGWKTEKGENRKIEQTIAARQIEIRPAVVSKEENELWFSIDKEDFEVKAVRITLLPKVVKMFCKKEKNVI